MADFRHFFAVRIAASALYDRRKSNGAAAMKGDPKVIDYPERGAPQRADRDQPILAALPAARPLGRLQARQVRAEGIDRGDGARRHGCRSASCSSTACPISSCSAACGSARRSRKCSRPIWRWSWRRCRSCATRSSIRKACAIMSAATCSAASSTAEEEHVDTLERQFEMIERMGLENYIQLNAKSERRSRLRRLA